jgi:hypothetical protein
MTSRPEPPSLEDVVEVTPEQIGVAITLLQAATFSQEVVSSVRIAIAGLKTLREIYALLSMCRISIQQLRRRLGIKAPKKDGGSDNDGGDVAAPDGDAQPESGDIGTQPEPAAPDPGSSDEAAKSGEITGGKPPKIRKDGQPYGRDDHGRRGKDDFPDALQRYFAHPDFDRPGCKCPECDKLKVFLMGAVGGGLRFTGQPHLTATGVNREIWRCGDCGAHFPAPLPVDLACDGGNSRVGHSAAATIACAKYLYGTPWARQESFGSLLDLHIPATTQWEQVRTLVAAAQPVYRYLFHVAAPADLFFSDDTGARIISLTAVDKTQRKTGKTVTRTGVHTSCVVSVLPDGRHIVIYKTAIIHAGELLDEILVNRPKGLLVPKHMSDGLSANPPTVCVVIEGECNAHARRKLEEKKDQWPSAWKFVKSVYKTVYKNDAMAAAQGMSPAERLALHRRDSLPLMQKMFRWMQGCFDNNTVEPNSNLGKIFEYFLTREYGLTMFCRHCGFPLDNNLCEGAQKLVAQHRKNAEYFRTERGAGAADVIMSLGATAKRSGANSHHYFVMLQRYKDEVKASPERFLPWNYRETVAALEKKAPPPQRVLEVSEDEFKDRQQRLKSTKAWGRPKASSPRTSIRAANN